MKTWQKKYLLVAVSGLFLLASPGLTLAGDGMNEDGIVPTEETGYDGNIESEENYDGGAVPAESPAGEVNTQQDWEQVTTGDWNSNEEYDGNENPTPAGMNSAEETYASENIEDEVITDSHEPVDNAVETVEETDLVEPQEQAAEANVSDFVAGDVNGDGELNALDCVILQKYIGQDFQFMDSRRGDVNGDGVISLLDVHALVNLIKSEGKGTGDVNGDGKIDSYDVQELTNYMAGQTASVNRKNADLNGDGEIDGKDLDMLREVMKVRNQQSLSDR